jgi:D-3-phosphoglycerate dehydrogenase / 2-oxoglutarate reductase
MSQPKPRLLLLDDWEGRIRRAPGFARVSALADATVLDQPLSEVPAEQLRNVRFVMAIRERTRFDAAAFDLLPNLELILQTGGHGYHIDRTRPPPAASRSRCGAAMTPLKQPCGN